MQKVAEIANILDIDEFKRIFKIFQPILTNLTLSNINFEKQKEYLRKFNSYTEQDLKLKNIMKFHSFFSKLLNHVFIKNPLTVHDLIRDAFLNRIACHSPNCLINCSDIHGCCHGNYSLDLIDYERIIDEDLLSTECFMFKNHRYRIKLKKVDNENVCSAFNLEKKICLIHKFKPPTCCKYPLISNTLIWNHKDKLWIGNCAHGGVWSTYISPIILQSLNKLWVKTILLWNKQQNYLKKKIII